jgi:hypothetical protein
MEAIPMSGVTGGRRKRTTSRIEAPALSRKGPVHRYSPRLPAPRRLSTQLSFSNSLIEVWWRSLKHRWLFLHPLDNIATVKRLVEFYVTEHNGRIPHGALYTA